MIMDRSHAAAEFLLDLRRTKRTSGTLPAEAMPRSHEEAYRAQAALVQKLLDQSKGQTIGYKAAATNEAAQKLLQVDAPFFGHLLSSSSFQSPASLPAKDFTVRVVEAEFGFEIGTDVPRRNDAYTKDSIAEFVAAVIPAIEIVDHRFHDWTAVGAASLIADNAIHGAWIAGDPVLDWRGTDLSLQAVSVAVNGEVIRTGSGAAVLGHPLNVVAWLANELPRFGLQLRRGDKLTTGTAAPVYTANPGDRIVADFGRFGRVEVYLEQ